MKHGRTFYDLYKSDKRVVSNRGGTRSSKTYSVLEWLVDYAHHNRAKKKTIVSVVRKTLPALRGSSMRDLFEILNRDNLYQESNHDKTNSEYTLYNTLFEFIGTDQPQKVRGRKRNVLFCNEANELTLEDFRQLSLRTTDRIILDYNPSDFESWIYSEVETRPDCDLFVTTYKDNPFLDASIISEIERYKDIDPNYWKIYGEGQIGVPQELVFNNWEYGTAPAIVQWTCHGMDFGFTNDPSTLIRVQLSGGKLFVKTLLYERGYTNNDLSEKIRSLDVYGEIVCDSAEPKSIEELFRLGHNVIPSEKGPDSVRAGIDLLRQYRIVVEPGDPLERELKMYKYKTDKNGKQLNEPIDAFNHIIDPLRYVMRHKVGKIHSFITVV